MEEVDVLCLQHTSFLQHRAFSLPTARLTVTPKDLAPFGSICPGSSTCVAPLSSSTYAGSRTCDLEAHNSGSLCPGSRSGSVRSGTGS